ncbi:hypothetical protein PRUG_00038 [Prochlorococcus phage P-SSP6]|uniref:Uncharacterized protein n=3 Tax=Tangaroavirus TaxID=2731981 RepID=M1PKX1_9CAUD|nr:hypothetical protein CYOG_00041 [Cyanophage 9515-10a]YP_005087544.1 hypothetical protein CYPG_00032 [Cyanophage NATL2A-133]ADP00062.1 predicted protein [Cyanophage 9515-10a]ADP00172.1 predicted protein [Cyanophage NATL2A-133]AGF91595.1 hypothetical protein PRUG_00038 [Prochlorococcus phage P-SSP6]
MYSLFDYMLSPPVRTVVVVSEEQLNDLKAQQLNEEIETVKRQREELEAAYNRRKQNLTDSLASLNTQVKALTPAKPAKKNVTTK